MGGEELEELDFDLPYSSSNRAANDDDHHRTVLLVGRTGNGKSATANSILGEKAFLSSSSSSGVTLTTQLQQTQFPDGQTLTVIDTPGLFDCELDHGFIGSEIIKCFRLASAGVHSILVVMSLRNRFSKEEEAVIHSLKELFGEKIYDYMIVVFTGGDDLDEEGKSIEDYLGSQSSKSLQEILCVCKNRKVIFDNRTKDKDKQTKQRKILVAMVDQVMRSNGGKPYSNAIFQEMQRADKDLRDLKERIKVLESVENSNSELSKLMMEKRQEENEEKLKQMMETIELKMTETNLLLKQQLMEEKAARLNAEEKVSRLNEEEKLARLNAEEKVAQLKSKFMAEIESLKKDRGCAIM